MNPITKKIDFAIVFDVKNANPNGDPMDGNRPRTNWDGCGEVTDVCLKRKIRNRLQDAGKEIFVQSEDRKTDGMKSLSDRLKAFSKTLPQNVQKDKEQMYNKVCAKWIDVRAFGQVFAFKKSDDVDSVSSGVRGPVTIQSAFSTEPVVIESVQITKSVNSETTDRKKSADTMGYKHRVNSATYVTYGSINPQLAEKTGFSEEDANAIKQAILTLFDNDESSARPSGSMNLVKVVWWTHNCKSGQYSSKTVHGSLDVQNNFAVKPLEGLAVEEFEC